MNKEHGIMNEEVAGKKRSLIIINKEFTWFVIARILFIAGLRMSPVLLGWRLYEITNSKLSLGILGLSEVIAAISFALPAGVKVDKSNKHRLISICMLVYFFLMAALLVITSHWFFSVTSKNYVAWSMYIILFITGAFRAYVGTAINAFLAQLVPSTSLVRAV